RPRRYWSEPMIGAEAARAPAPAQRGALAFPGVQALLEGLGEMALLSRDALRQLLARPPEWRLVVDQLEQIGWRSLSIVNLTALFTGMVLALQLGNYLARFGAKMFVSRIVGMSLVREMGPVLTALMIGGRVGAGITAELGSMAVTEQIDAVRTLCPSPIRNLVLARMFAILITLPLPRRAHRRDARQPRRQRLRQERAAEAHERAPPAGRRHGGGRRRGDRCARRERAPPGPPQGRHAVPAGRALRLADRRRQRGVSPARASAAASRRHPGARAG